MQSTLETQEPLVAVEEVLLVEPVEELATPEERKYSSGKVRRWAYEGVKLFAKWAASPVLMGAQLGGAFLRDYGTFREIQAQAIPQEEMRWRDSLNHSVRKIGNKVSGGIKIRLNYGLGDLLTEEINFRSAGAVVGGLAPLASMYALTVREGPVRSVVKISGAIAIGGPVSLATCLASGAVGYSTGNRLDFLLGDNSPRYFGDYRKLDLNVSNSVSNSMQNWF